MSVHVKDRLASARGHLKRGERDEAESLLVALSREHPGFADIHNELGLLFHDKGEFSRAEAAFLRALEINPAYTEASLHLAITWNDLGRYEEARQIFAETMARSRGGASGVDPVLAKRIAPLHIQVGDLYAQAGHASRAAEAYAAALELCPTFNDVRLKRARALLDAGAPSAAIVEVDHVLAAQPDHPAAMITLGLAHHAAGQRDRAAVVWRTVLEKDPTNTQAAMYLRLSVHPERAAP